MMRRVLPVLLALWLCGCGPCGRGGDSRAEGALRRLTVARLEAYKSLDPQRQFDAASADLVRNLYDRLLDYDYLARPFALSPNLLTRLPGLSKDRLTYTFELRDDVRFIDDPCFDGGKGRPLVVEDVIYTFERFADANVNALSYSLWQGVIKGMDEYRARTAELRPGADRGALSISGLRKLDARHFTLELTRENPRALLALASNALAIVPREAVQHYGDQFAHHPVGTGPFWLKQGSRRGVIVLARNPRYHLRYPEHGSAGDAEAGLLRDAGKPLPRIDEVHLPLIEEPQPRMLQFLAGQLDWVPFDRDTFASMTVRDTLGVRLSAAHEGKFRLYLEPDLRVDGLRFNFKDARLGSNRALRQAIAHALDASAFVAQMYNGRGAALRTLIPLPIAGSERDVAASAPSHDAQSIRRKLAEAGFPGGRGLPPLTVDYRSTTSVTRANYEFQRARLARFGIALQANFQSFTAYMKKVEAGDFQIIDFSWGADYPDAENFYQMLYSHNRAPGSNYGSYDNPEYDRLFEEIRFMPNGPERYARFERMNALIREDVPVAMLWNLTRTGLTQRWVRNFKYHPLLEVPFAYLDVEPRAPAQPRAPGTP